MGIKFKLTEDIVRDLAKVDREMDDTTLKMIIDVLVNGKSQRAVAATYGKKQQFLNERVKRLYARLANQAKHIPDGFNLVTVYVDDDQLKKLEESETSLVHSLQHPQ